eukprot:TRINITY_DN11028_c0_g1_i12.p1 TRINITY_DN11028_c0_g1~~TRINITY_DN11028_c0_g1_i12.p1  ORF type:complete len:147 (-),score=16.62 TRINITY_DN11028_c0_g1_i12:67-507(-)
MVSLAVCLRCWRVGHPSQDSISWTLEFMAANVMCRSCLRTDMTVKDRPGVLFPSTYIIVFDLIYSVYVYDFRHCDAMASSDQLVMSEVKIEIDVAEEPAPTWRSQHHCSGQCHCHFPQRDSLCTQHHMSCQLCWADRTHVTSAVLG